MNTVINLSVAYNESEILNYLGNYKISFSRKTLVILTCCIPLCLILKQCKAHKLLTQVIVFTSSTSMITCCSYHGQLQSLAPEYYHHYHYELGPTTAKLCQYSNIQC
jgi:hypothetical protein